MMVEPHKQAELESYSGPFEPSVYRKPFGEPWKPDYFVKWATIWHAFRSLGIEPETEVLDLGAGPGWTSVFLAESGYRPTALDFAEANIAVTRERADRYGGEVQAVVADMDDFELGRTFGAVLVFDALHHSIRPAAVVNRIAAHLEPGGWVLFGEPSMLHYISLEARRVRREAGWTERGVSVRKLRRDCQAAGLGHCRRFFEGTGPYESRAAGFLWQLVSLAGANVAFAPRVSIWLAARKL
jgi:SAM-dependent methyltransferase